MYLLDSSVIIGMNKFQEIKDEIISFIGEEESATSSLSIHEVLIGSKTEKEFFVLSNLFSWFNIFNYDDKCAQISAEIYLHLKERGEMINQFDILIASIAIKNDLTVVSYDKDFTKIPDLKVKIFDIN